MSSVVKKCPKDGIVYDAVFTGNCASCFGPLKFFCKTHNEWLEGADCPKCAGTTPAAGTAAATPTASAGPSIVGMLAVLAICIGVFVVCGLFLYRAMYTKPKPVSAPVAPAVVPAAKPAPPSPPRPVSAPSVATLSLNQLLANPDPYIGKMVKLTGTVQFRDTGRETFDLRDGEHILTVQYHAVPAAAKTMIAGASSSRTVAVTGVLRRDDSDNSYSVVAGSIEMP
jgi:hypothetical protein